MHARDMRFAKPKMPREQQVLFPHYLDELVGAASPVRILAGLLEEVDWSAWEKSYTGCGQPPIHPRYLAGAILYGLLNRERSSRELERAARKDLDFIWLFEGFTPDHSTFAEFRTRHGEALEGLHAEIARKLVMRKEKALLHLIIDGTRMQADSARQGARTADTIEYIIGELARRMEELKQRDAGEHSRSADETAYLEGFVPDAAPADPPAPADGEMARLQAKQAKYQKALETARERDERSREHNGTKAKPVRVPVTDPDAQMLPNKAGGYAPNYTPVAAVEAETGAILYAQVLEGSQESGAVAPAVTAAQSLLGQRVEAVLADGNFAAGPVLAELAEQSIDAFMPTRSASPADNPAPRPDPTIPVAEEDRKRLPLTGGQFSRTAFVYDPEADAYYCPMGKELRPYKRSKSKEGVACTLYECTACAGCPLAAQCIKGRGEKRNITRDEHESLREAVDARMATPEGKALYKTRAPGIETVFGIIKSALGIRRFSLRGLDKVRIEWAWICTAYNLKKLLALEAKIASQAPQGPKTAAMNGSYGTRPDPRRTQWSTQPRCSGISTTMDRTIHFDQRLLAVA